MKINQRASKFYDQVLNNIRVNAKSFMSLFLFCLKEISILWNACFFPALKRFPTTLNKILHTFIIVINF